MDPHNTSQGWIKCPDGMLEQMAAQNQTARRRKVLGKATTVAIVACLGFVLISLLIPPSPTPPGGLQCAEVQQLVPSFRDGTLDDAITRRVRIHITECPNCQKEFGSLIALKHRFQLLLASRSLRSIE